MATRQLCVKTSLDAFHPMTTQQSSSKMKFLLTKPYVYLLRSDSRWLESGSADKKRGAREAVAGHGWSSWRRAPDKIEDLVSQDLKTAL